MTSGELCLLRNDIISVIADGFDESRLSVAGANESKLLSFSVKISVTNLYICAHSIFKVDLAKPGPHTKEFRPLLDRSAKKIWNRVYIPLCDFEVVFYMALLSHCEKIICMGFVYQK